MPPSVKQGTLIFMSSFVKIFFIIFSGLALVNVRTRTLTLGSRQTGQSVSIKKWPGIAATPQTLPVKLRQRHLDERNALFPQGFFFAPGGGPADVSALFLSMMDPEGDFRKLVAHVIEVLMDVLLQRTDEFQRRLAVLRRCRSGTVVPSPDHGRRSDQRRLRISADGTRDEFLQPLFIEGAPVLEPTFKFMAVTALEIVDDHASSPRH